MVTPIDNHTFMHNTKCDDLKTLPAQYYYDEQVLFQEKEHLFFKSWQYACHASELTSPGSYVTTEILGQNILVLRETHGEIKAFYNVCPHRGHKLLEGKGYRRVIVCPYHQWSFRLDGHLQANRATSTSRSANSVQACLYPVRVDRLLDFIFINLDQNAEPIAGYWPGLETLILKCIPGVKSYTLSDQVSALHPVDLRANWKIHIENFLECYHCRAGHPSFSDMLDVGNQKQTLYRNYSYVFIPSSGKANNKAYPLNPEFDEMDLHFWHLFPNIGLAQFAGPGNLSISQWLPIGPNRAQRKIAQLDVSEQTDDGMFDRIALRTVWARDVLQPEDITFIESVHQGMSQRCFEHGWYMLDPENEEISEIMLKHFHQIYLEQMRLSDHRLQQL